MAQYICMRTAFFSEVPQNLFILRCCLIHLKTAPHSIYFGITEKSAQPSVKIVRQENVSCHFRGLNNELSKFIGVILELL